MQIRLLRTLISSVLKTSKNGDCKVSPGNWLHSLNYSHREFYVYSIKTYRASIYKQSLPTHCAPHIALCSQKFPCGFWGVAVRYPKVTSYLGWMNLWPQISPWPPWQPFIEIAPVYKLFPYCEAQNWTSYYKLLWSNECEEKWNNNILWSSGYRPADTGQEAVNLSHC